VPSLEEQQLEEKKLEIQRQIEALQQSLLQQTVPPPSVPQSSQTPQSSQPVVQPTFVVFPEQNTQQKNAQQSNPRFTPIANCPEPQHPQTRQLFPEQQTGATPSANPPDAHSAVHRQTNFQPTVSAPAFHAEQAYVKEKNGDSGSVQFQTGSATLGIRIFAVLFVAIPVLVYAYWFTIADLVNTWSKVIDYHHGYFVVPFVIYFLWARRDTFPTNGKMFDYWFGILLGTLLLGLWSFLRYQIMLFSMVSLDAWTILLWVFGVTLIFFGLRVFLWAVPSLFFLAFMFPWPVTLEMALRRPLQEFAAKLSVVLLRIIGEPAVSSKNTIFLGDQQLDVAAACSGIRVLVSVVAAAYAAALLMRRPWWQNILLFCLVVPVALMINAMRIAMTGLLIVHASGYIDRFDFDKPTPVVADEISGIIMLILAFVSFVAIIFWLGKVFRRVTPVS
ncbi:MAG: archaeosortase/exosortase family protein, partial [Planctomycetaceae bacterium]|nr:archaeosortase/exosortase family protein [Planctomycetaceae bacterium]